MTAAPVITAITEASGVVTLTITQADAAPVDVYSRAAGAAPWTLRASNQAVASPIAIAGLTAGTTYEFYAVAIKEEVSSAPSNILYIYLHDSNLPTVSEIELAAAGVLNLLGVFKTAARWLHQLSATEGGLTNLDKHGPCAFVGEQPSMNIEREGGFTLDRKITLVVILAQKSMTNGGEARTGDATTVGTQELRTLVIAALDRWHPGAGFDCDEFFYKGAEEIIDTPKQHGVKLVFEAKWLVN
jgi:hypothetical protein